MIEGRVMDVLIADDEKSILIPLKDDLTSAGHNVVAATDGFEAMNLARKRSFDCIITDIKMPGLDGIELLKEVKKEYEDTQVIIITGYGTIESAVEAMKMGAYDYILKPFFNEEILLILEKIARMKELQEENIRLKQELEDLHGFENIVGKSRKMLEIFKLIRIVSQTDSNVLIRGESGTGKELIARAIHYNSPRRNKPLVALSCAALPPTLLEAELFGHEKGAFTDACKQKIGRFEKANGGTIFLDDIDDMSLPTQVKLLRVLQEREIERLGGEELILVDIRVVAAAKRDLEEMAGKGEFREDLYYRLNVVQIELPTLRDRREDIPLLVWHFVKKYGKGKEYDIKPDVMDALCAYSWPGNVRELENAVERAIALSGESRVLKKEYLIRTSSHHKKAFAVPKDLRPLKEVMESMEKGYLKEVLKITGGHKAQAAKILGISRKNLWEKIREFGLE